MYINRTSKGPIRGNKVKALLDDGADIVGMDNNFPLFEPNMVVVVNNGDFEAAGYAYDEREYNRFCRPDGRQKTYMIYPKAKQYAE